MLAGASGLKRARLYVQMLQYLPMSTRKGLRSLHLHSCLPQAMPNVVQALLDCEQLEELTINCSSCNSNIPVLDLRHLVQLRKCNFQFLSAPGKLLLSQGDIELIVSCDQLTAWSRLQHQVRNQVLCMAVGAAPSIEVQHAWPQGLEAFRNLQFLKVTVWDFWPYGHACADDDILDLSHFAYIPHLSLKSLSRLHVKISVGSWKVLQLESTRAFNVVIPDAKAFMKGIGGFCFKFEREERPEDLINKLGKAGMETGAVLYEHHCATNSSWIVLSNVKPDPDNLARYEDMFLEARIANWNCSACPNR